MAEDTLHIELCAPEHAPTTVEATEVVIPGAAGIFTILPGHTPLLSTLTFGAVAITKEDGDREFYAVHNGFAEILRNRILILADVMEPGESIDQERAQQAHDRAAKRLEKIEEGTDVKRAELALARATARLQAQSGGAE